MDPEDGDSFLSVIFGEGLSGDDGDDDDGYYIPTKGSGDKFTTNFILLVFFLLLNIY